MIRKMIDMVVIGSMVAAFGITRDASAQAVGASFTPRPMPVYTGTHDGSGEQERVAYSDVIVVTHAKLVRFHVASSDLGQSSYITLTSLVDGGVQRFNDASLAEWDHWSAIFNGGLVRLELHVAPSDRNVHLEIDKVSVGEWGGPLQPLDGGLVGGGDGGIASICGSDNRVASGDSRVGRLSGANCGNGGGCGGCTGWLVSNGGVLTAGHCNGFAGNIIEFNVPMSSSNGNPNAANPDDQYPVGVNYLLYESNGVGHDWAIMSVGANSNTGLRPHIVQGFFHMSNLTPSGGATIRVTGYGLDNSPNGSGGANASCCDEDNDGFCEYNCNSTSLTEQTATGPFDELDGSQLHYVVDTTPANSGSPVIREANGYTLGIHTAGGCESYGYNFGTSFTYSPLANGLQTVIGNTTIFVDVAPVAAFQIGTVVYPAQTVMFAAGVAQAGATIWIVEGNYTAAAGNTGTITKAMLLTAPVGTVTIGQ